MRFPIDKTLNRIFQETSEETGASRDQVRESFYLLWYNVRALMRPFTMPTIIIPKWGRYVPKISILRRLHKKLLNKGDTGFFYEEISEVINRIEKENKQRKRK